jgi:hypothetical protein
VIKISVKKGADVTTPPPSKIIQFPLPHRHHFLLTNDEHDFLTDMIGPYHGRPLADFIAAAMVVPAGRRISGTEDDFVMLSNAVDIEIIAYRKIESDDGTKPRRKPKPGGTVARLMAISDKLTPYHS